MHAEGDVAVDAVEPEFAVAELPVLLARLEEYVLQKRAHPRGNRLLKIQAQEKEESQPGRENPESSVQSVSDGTTIGGFS